MKRIQALFPTALLVITATVALIALQPVSAHSQEPPPAIEATPQPGPEPAEHSSARATMRTFLEAFYHEEGAQLEVAAACLDLKDLPSTVRVVRGRELAVVLKNVLDRTRYVRFEEIPDDQGGPPYVFLRRSEGEVVLSRAHDGRWLFTRETVDSLDALRRATESLAVVEGVGEYQASVSSAMWLRERMSESLRRPLLFLELWQWIGLVLLVLLGVIADRLFLAISQGFVRRILRRRLEKVDRVLLIRALKPAGALVMVVVWWIGISLLGLPSKVLTVYADAVWVVLIMAACATTYRLISLVANALSKRAESTESRADDLLVPLIRKSLKVLVVAVGIVLVADALNQNLTGIVAGLGLGGLAFALAAQDTVGNLFGSLTVLLDRPFHVGDWVVIGDVEGTVEEVGFRSTRIRTFYNSQITLPNANLTRAAVDNLGDRTYRRWSTRLGLTYDTPPAKIDAFCEGVRELIMRHPYTRKDYFHVYFNEFGGSSLEVMLYVFFQTPDWATELRERHRLAVDIVRLAADVGVDFAFPTQTVYLHSVEGEAREPAENGYVLASQRQREHARDRARDLTEALVQGGVPEPVVTSELSNESPEPGGAAG